METLPVQILFLTFLAGSQAHPHTAPTASCPNATQIAQCDASNNFYETFKVANDPKSWTAGDMDVLCANKDEYASYMSCMISAERQCWGTANEDYAIDSTMIEDYYLFACQEKQAIPGTCVTDQKVNIETCYANAVATITTSTTNYKCLWLTQLEKCYTDNMAACETHTKNVVDILLYKMTPPKCGCDVMKASLSFLLLAAGAAILTSKKIGITS